MSLPEEDVEEDVEEKVELPLDELDEELSSMGSLGSGMFACFGGWFAPEQATNNARDATQDRAPRIARSAESTLMRRR